MPFLEFNGNLQSDHPVCLYVKLFKDITQLTLSVSHSYILEQAALEAIKREIEVSFRDYIRIVEK